MIPIVTPAEMAAIDAASPEPVVALIERAGEAVERSALDLLGGAYGRRVLVIAGKGNNGNDGRVAARRLAARGVRVEVLDPLALPPRLPKTDLVIDAAFGTGFRGEWFAPPVGEVPVLSVDIPSGVDGLTGALGGRPFHADRTVTFAALKPGLVLAPGRFSAGRVEVADIGLDASAAHAHLVELSDVAAWCPPRPRDAHKWRAAVMAVAGSPGMLGAAHLVARSAQRAGAGMVRLATPGVATDPAAPTEAVRIALPLAGWSNVVLDSLDRAHALVIGPGLGRTEAVASETRALVGSAPVPVVVDGDGLVALGWSAEGPRPVLRGRSAPTVLTPHDGEYAVLRGARPESDRLAAARLLAADTGAVVLLKGPTTVVADPGGQVLVVTRGDERLATAGTGDVLAGIVGALLARGTPAFEAAAAGAWLHGVAAEHGPRRGLVAGDLPELLPDVLDSL